MSRLCLFADVAQLSAIRDFVVNSSRELGLPDRIVYDLELAVDEACTNVLNHGYGGQAGKIEIEVTLKDDSVCVTIRDWGARFQPEEIPIPDVSAPLEQRRPGGLGLFLMQQVMDDLDFQFDPKDGNTLTMLKRLHRRG